MKKQTAVEWLEMQLKKGIEYNPLDLSGYAKAVDKVFEQAKAMEKEQIELAFRDGWFDGNNPLIFNIENERYYNETYNK